MRAGTIGLTISVGELGNLVDGHVVAPPQEIDRSGRRLYPELLVTNPANDMFRKMAELDAYCCFRIAGSRLVSTLSPGATLPSRPWATAFLGLDQRLESTRYPKLDEQLFAGGEMADSCGVSEVFDRGNRLRLQRSCSSDQHDMSEARR